LDNLTHTLIGLVAGETVARAAPGDPAGLAPQSRRTALLALGMIGGNLPDIDLLWSMQTFAHSKLGYLLHHRGYTHTLLGCVVLAALLYAGCLAWLRIRGQSAGTRDRWQLGLFALMAVLLHLGMDAFNSYGVHPFWPWNNRWYYGDAVFIVEPLYWVAAAPLFFLLRSVAARSLLALALMIASGAILFVHELAWEWWGVPVATILLAVLGRRLQPIRACVTSTALVLLVTLVFTGTAAMAARQVDEIGRAFTGFQTLDQVLSPSPAQPFCWDVLLLQRRGDEYVARRGRLNIVTQAQCRSVLSDEGTAPMTSASPPGGPQAMSDSLHWTGEFAMSRARLAALAGSTCATRGLMQFVRAPYAAKTPSGWVLGDLRFDRERGLGLAEILAGAADAADCRYHLPWIAPRADLLAR
jgi:inner membrane protein